MTARPPRRTDPFQPSRIAHRELRLEVLPFVRELAAGRGDRRDAFCGTADARDPRAVEAVSAAVGLVLDRAEVARDRGTRPLRAPEARELRMMAVAHRPPGEHRLGEERLAPERDQAARVEERRVERPEPQPPPFPRALARRARNSANRSASRCSKPRADGS